MNADELAASVVLLVQPVGIDESRNVVVREGANSLEEPLGIVSHAVIVGHSRREWQCHDRKKGITAFALWRITASELPGKFQSKAGAGAAVGGAVGEFAAESGGPLPCERQPKAGPARGGVGIVAPAEGAEDA